MVYNNINNYIRLITDKRGTYMQKFEWNKRNTAIAVSVAVYAVLAMLFLVIINSETISSWLGAVFSVLMPLIMGCAIAYLCNPIMKMFENRVYFKLKSQHIKRTLSLISTYLLIALGLTIVLLIVIPQLIASYNDFIGNLEGYTDEAITFINKLLYELNASNTEEFSGYIDISDVQQKIAEFFTSSTNLLSTVGKYALSYGTSIAVALKNIFFGLFIAIYILSSKEKLKAQIRRLLFALMKEKHFNTLCEWISFTNLTFDRYFKAQLLDALLIAIECAVIFSITGMPYSVLLAFIIGLTNIIPVFGPFIGGIPAAFIVLITDPSKVILFVVLLVIIQQIDGNIILPKLIGNSIGMSSLGVLCAIIIMGGYFGVMGMILGVPFFVVIGEATKKLIHTRLEKRGMPEALTEYGTPDDPVLEEECVEHKSLVVRIYEAIAAFFSRIIAKIKTIFKRKAPKKDDKKDDQNG